MTLKRILILLRSIVKVIEPRISFIKNIFTFTKMYIVNAQYLNH
jgi:phage-related protein